MASLCVLSVIQRMQLFPYPTEIEQARTVHWGCFAATACPSVAPQIQCQAPHCTSLLHAVLLHFPFLCSACCLACMEYDSVLACMEYDSVAGSHWLSEQRSAHHSRVAAKQTTRHCATHLKLKAPQPVLPDAELTVKLSVLALARTSQVTCASAGLVLCDAMADDTDVRGLLLAVDRHTGSSLGAPWMPTNQPPW